MSVIAAQLNNLLALAAEAEGSESALRELIGLLSSGHEPRDAALHELLEQLALRLLAQSPAEARDLCAQRLGVLATAPRRLVTRLAEDDIEIARYVLHSPSLTRSHLLSLIHNTTADHRALIAERADLDAGLSTALLTYQEESVLNSLVSNHKANLSPDCLDRLIVLSSRYRLLQIPLLQRPDLPVSAIKALYARVSIPLQTYIDKRFGRMLKDELRKDAAIATVELLAGKGRLRPSFLLRALHQRNTDLLAATLSHFSEMPFALMRATVKQAAAGPLARLCRAMGVGRHGFETILLLNRKLQGLSVSLDVEETREVDAVYPRPTTSLRTAECAA